MHAWENVRVYSIDTLNECCVYAAGVKAADFDLSIYIYVQCTHIPHECCIVCVSECVGARVRVCVYLYVFLHDVLT